jgi:cytochrome c oxidase subunit 2
MSAETPKPTTNNNSLLWIVAAFALFIFGGFVIAEATPLLFPTQASAEATQVDSLFKFMLVIGGAIFLLVQGALLYSVIRFRARPGDRADGPPIHGNATLEVVWTAIPAVIVLVLSIYSYSVWVSTTEAKPNEQTVEGIGRRFAWTFAYDVPASAVPDDVVVADLPPVVQSQLASRGSFTVSSSELHTFVGQPILMALRTEDAQHAFWIPAMRIKQDLLPGRVTNIRFTPIQAGTYPVVCAELCGDGHGAMRATIIVHPDEQTYLTWLNDTASTVFYPPEDPVERGQQILASGVYPCAGCHILDDFGWMGVTGPNQNNVADRVLSNRVPATGQPPEEYLLRSLYFPGEYLVPGFGNLMPRFQPEDPGAPNYMPVDDAVAITAYFCQLTSSGENVCDLENLDAIAEEFR